MTGKPVLYGLDRSPPVRAVRMTFAELGLDYKYKVINPGEGELRTPEFLKKNPNHTVPTLEEEDGTIIWDSHAVMAYLVRKYGKTDDLYPKGFHERAIVDQFLHYENGVLFIGLGKGTLGPILRGIGKKDDIPESQEKIKEAYATLEAFFGDNQFIAGKKLTIADFSIVTTLSALDLLVPVKSAGWPKLSAWYERMQKLPYYDSVNSVGIRQLDEMLKEKIAAL